MVLAFALAIGLAVALVVAGIVLRSDDEDAGPNPTPAVDFAGIPQDGIVLGSPEADVLLIEYADLQCPACRAYSETFLPEIVDSYVRPGDLRLEFRGVSFLGPDSETALRYVLAAGLQDKLWDFQEALYRNQGSENSGWVTEELIRLVGAEIDGLDVDRVIADAESDEVTTMLEDSRRLATAAQIPGTPTLALAVGDEAPTQLEPGLSLTQLIAAIDDALGR